LRASLEDIMSDRLTPQAALIYVMVVISAADRRMSDRELKTIGSIVQTLPIFRGFDPDKLVPTAEACADAMGGESGLQAVLDHVAAVLPARLKETAYALAVEVAAADGNEIAQEVLRLLEIIRFALPVEPLIAAAIERAARARQATL
jgi:tellurite resistance protein